MAYVTAADLRADTAAEFAHDITIDEGTVPLDASLTATIARVSQDIEEWCNDRFESTASDTLTLYGDGTNILQLPRRTTAITSINVVSSLGTSTLQTATTYRLHSSLDTAGARRRSPGALDYLEIPPWNYLAGSTFGPTAYWPIEPNSIVIVGATGWITTPAKIKRAVALLVYDFYTPSADILRNAITLNDAGTSYSFVRDEDHPSGIPEVDETVKAYRYASDVAYIG